MDAVRTGPRVRAPELRTGERAAAGWINSAPLTLAGLRGRFVLLDFWTSACANCLHVLAELRPLEAERADVLTVLGVHSPKFPHEAERATVAAAIERYGITHPVLNDPELLLWQQYAVRAWPTLVLVDPAGYVVAQAAGEGQVAALAVILDRLVAEHTASGTLHRGIPVPSTSADPSTTLRYPAKAIVLPAARTDAASDTLLVADAGHHQLVEIAAAGTPGQRVLRRIGDAQRGHPFAEPNGLTLLPAGLADYDVLVADTANHVLRGVRLSDGAIVACIDLPALLADARTITGAVPPMLSPWDVAWWPATERVVVAAAGVHLLLSFDPVHGTAEILAGTTVEGLRDGPALDGWLAQPSGLAADGDQLWFVDAETSALRRLTADGTLHTVVGEGLFDFGYLDGGAASARFQHPLGVTLLADRTLAVADTFNGALRRVDPARGTVETIADGLAEPSGAVLVGAELIVVESAAHRLMPLGVRRRNVANRSASVDLSPGPVTLRIAFQPARGRKLDDSAGPAIQLDVAAAPADLLVDGGGSSHALTRGLVLRDGIAGVLQVSAQVASCDDDPAHPHPACYLSRQDWAVPVRVTPGGPTELTLALPD